MYREPTSSDGKETGTQINGVDQKEERNIQPEKNEATRIRKNEEPPGHLEMFQHPNYRGARRRRGRTKN